MESFRLHTYGDTERWAPPLDWDAKDKRVLSMRMAGRVRAIDPRNIVVRFDPLGPLVGSSTTVDENGEFEVVLWAWYHSVNH